jgi:hypothetical protein
LEETCNERVSMAGVVVIAVIAILKIMIGNQLTRYQIGYICVKFIYDLQCSIQNSLTQRDILGHSSDSNADEYKLFNKNQ